MAPGSTPCCAAIRATTGETNVLPLPLGASAGAVEAGGAAGAAGCSAGAVATGSVAADGAGSGAAASSAAGVSSWSGSAGSAGAAGAAPAAPITASTVPTSTVSPSWTRISATTPSPGLGTSVSTLSVEISSSGSSSATLSPTCLSQRVIVPSETETPIWGITTSTWVPVLTFSRLLGSSVSGEVAERRRDVLDLRDVCLLERGRERYRAVGRREPPDRRVELLERLLGNGRRDLPAEAARLRVLVEHENLRAPLDALEDRLAVPRDQRPEVEDLDGDAVLGQLGGGLVRRVDHRTPGDHRHVVALAVDSRLPERRRVAIVRHFAADPAIEVLVLEEEHGIGILDGRREQPLRVLGGGGTDHLEARDVREARLGVLRMERPAGEAAAGREPENDRDRRARAIVLLRRDGDEVIPGAGDEVGE